MQRKTLALGVMLAMTAGLSLSASASHINGVDKDNIATALNLLAGTNGGDTIFNDMWFSGTTVLIDEDRGPLDSTLSDCIANDGGGGVPTTNCFNDNWELRELVDGATTPGNCDAQDQTVGDAICDTVLVEEPIFTQGVTLCESNSLMDPTILSDANAGYGGRCSSSSSSGGTPAIGTATRSFTYDNWNKMEVFAGDNAGGAPAAMGCAASLPDNGKATFYARVGNNAHGLEVNDTASFYYRDIVAFLVDAEHVTYFMKADEVSAGGAPTDCWGTDSHSDVADGADADATAGEGEDIPGTPVCNDLEEAASSPPADDDGGGSVYNSFQTGTYEAISPAAGGENFDAQTVCTA